MERNESRRWNVLKIKIRGPRNGAATRWKLLRRASKQNCPSSIVLPLLYSPASVHACTHEPWGSCAPIFHPRRAKATTEPKKETRERVRLTEIAINHKFGLDCVTSVAACDRKCRLAPNWRLRRLFVVKRILRSREKRIEIPSSRKGFFNRNLELKFSFVRLLFQGSFFPREGK